jgi:ribonuclease HII
LLKPFHISGVYEAGCDEAGRGALAGPVFAAAVILPADFRLPKLNDSKLLTENKREYCRKIIEYQAISWAIGTANEDEIDSVNIRNASILAMHRAIDNLRTAPCQLIIDGNYFKDHRNIPFTCFVKGDANYQSIAAASVLAKTHRDDYMKQIHKEFPQYFWDENKGYATRKHVKSILDFGFTKYHRKSFHLKSLQLSFPFS